MRGLAAEAQRNERRRGAGAEGGGLRSALSLGTVWADGRSLRLVRRLSTPSVAGYSDQGWVGHGWGQDGRKVPYLIVSMGRWNDKTRELIGHERGSKHDNEKYLLQKKTIWARHAGCHAAIGLRLELRRFTLS